jgi:hypothetical protein
MASLQTPISNGGGPARGRSPWALGLGNRKFMSGVRA